PQHLLAGTPEQSQCRSVAEPVLEIDDATSGIAHRSHPEERLVEAIEGGEDVFLLGSVGGTKASWVRCHHFTLSVAVVGWTATGRTVGNLRQRPSRTAGARR